MRARFNDNSLDIHSTIAQGRLHSGVLLVGRLCNPNMGCQHTKILPHSDASHWISCYTETRNDRWVSMQPIQPSLHIQPTPTYHPQAGIWSQQGEDMLIGMWLETQSLNGIHGKDLQNIEAFAGKFKIDFSDNGITERR